MGKILTKSSNFGNIINIYWNQIAENICKRTLDLAIQTHIMTMAKEEIEAWKRFGSCGNPAELVSPREAHEISK